MKKIPFSEVKIGEEFFGLSGQKYEKASDKHATYKADMQFSPNYLVKVVRPITFEELSPGDIFTFSGNEFQKMEGGNMNAIWTGNANNSIKYTICSFGDNDIVIPK